ncbi:MAG: WD40 repeat domain-containing protein [Planctomycetes bacterium]|nr:WD40 repeat domain-containing protein [Planctomycetota bacterium]
MDNLIRILILLCVFVFVSCETTVETDDTVLNEQKANRLIEDKAYIEAKNGVSHDCAAYLTKYPNGKYADAIIKRILNLSLLTLKGHNAAVRSVSFSPNGKILASGSRRDTGKDDDKGYIIWEGEIKLWDVSSGKCIRTFNGHSNYVYSVCFSPDGKLLASGSVSDTGMLKTDEDTEIKIWDVSSGKCILTLKGHKGFVYSVSFSPDGKILASGSGGWDWNNFESFGEIKLWDVSDMSIAKELCTLKGHSSFVNSVSFTPDGTLLASSSYRETGTKDDSGSANLIGEIKLWDVSDTINVKELNTLEGHRNLVSSVDFSPDGKILVSGSLDRTIKLWDVTEPSNAKVLHTIEGLTGTVFSVGFSPDGKNLASASARDTGKKDADEYSIWDGKIELWDVSDPCNVKALLTLEEHNSSAYSVCFSPDGTILASGSADSTIKLWPTQKYLKDILNIDEVKLLKLQMEEETERAYEMAKNGTFQDCEAYLSNYPSGKHADEIKKRFLSLPIRTLEGHNGSVWSVSFSPDGKIIASGSYDDTIKLWDVSSGKCVSTLEGHSGDVFSVNFSADGKFIASASSESKKPGIINLWDVSDIAKVKKLHTLEGHSHSVRDVRFSPDGKILASGARDNTIKLWDVSGGKCFRTLEGHSSSVFSVSFSPNGKILASASFDKTIKLWDISDINNVKELRTLEGHSGGVFSVSFSPDGNTLASGSFDKTVKLWDAASGSCIRTIKGHRLSVYSVSFSSDGKILVSASDSDTGKKDNYGYSIWEGKIELWDVSNIHNVKELRTITLTEPVYSVSFSHDRKIFVSGSKGKSIKLWSTLKYLDELLAKTKNGVK